MASDGPAVGVMGARASLARLGGVLADRGFHVRQLHGLAEQDRGSEVEAILAHEEVVQNAAEVAEVIKASVVGVVTDTTLDSILATVQDGADAVVHEHASANEAIRVVHAASDGVCLLDFGHLRELASIHRRQQWPSCLDDTEMDLLAHLASGARMSSIAIAMHVSERTLYRMCSRLYQVLDVASRSEAVALLPRAVSFPTESYHSALRVAKGRLEEAGLA